jgi:hypothetical protein
MKAIALAISLAALSINPVLAQDPTPMPAAEYRAGLVAYEQAVTASSEAADEASDAMLTVANVTARLEVSVAMGKSELERLETIVPEPCYADAHAQYLDYSAYFIATMQESILPALQDANTILDIIPVANAVGAEIESRFPAFHVFPDPEATPEPNTMQIGSEAEFQHLRAFDTLNTCEGLMASPAPSGEPSAG